jgi:hypothetical protein
MAYVGAHCSTRLVTLCYLRDGLRWARSRGYIWRNVSSISVDGNGEELTSPRGAPFVTEIHCVVLCQLVGAGGGRVYLPMHKSHFRSPVLAFACCQPSSLPSRTRDSIPQCTRRVLPLHCRRSRYLSDPQSI